MWIQRYGANIACVHCRHERAWRSEVRAWTLWNPCLKCWQCFIIAATLEPVWDTRHRSDDNARKPSSGRGFTTDHCGPKNPIADGERVWCLLPQNPIPCFPSFGPRWLRPCLKFLRNISLSWAVGVIIFIIIIIIVVIIIMSCENATEQ